MTKPIWPPTLSCADALGTSPAQNVTTRATQKARRHVLRQSLLFITLPPQNVYFCDPNASQSRLRHFDSDIFARSPLCLTTICGFLRASLGLAASRVAGNAKRKPIGMLVSPLPSPNSLLTVNLHRTSCFVQTLWKSLTPALSRA